MLFLERNMVMYIRGILFKFFSLKLSMINSMKSKHTLDPISKALKPPLRIPGGYSKLLTLVIID